MDSSMDYVDDNDNNNGPVSTSNNDRNKRSNRPRRYQCKHCGYIAMTKQDYWAHRPLHMEIEKMLNCPECSFVTEFKHHLEYHLRNHYNSKPFLCTFPGCEYRCVNKSMLNSHLKSHSKVHQFRCRDCSYATKYCHSLKLHLRKHKHAPSLVLNQDGTINPYQIIDIYGTRRGLRRKRKPANSSSSPNYSSTSPRPSITPSTASSSAPLSFSLKARESAGGGGGGAAAEAAAAEAAVAGLGGSLAALSLSSTSSMATFSMATTSSTTITSALSTPPTLTTPTTPPSNSHSFSTTNASSNSPSPLRNIQLGTPFICIPLIPNVPPKTFSEDVPLDLTRNKYQ